MPRYNGTGPDGRGPRTGRGQGDCPPNNKTKTDSLPRRLGRRALGRLRGLRTGK